MAVLALSIVRWILPEKGLKDYSKLARYSTEHTSPRENSTTTARVTILLEPNNLSNYLPGLITSSWSLEVAEDMHLQCCAWALSAGICI